MQWGVTVGILVVVAFVASFLVYFLRGPLNSQDAHKVDKPPKDSD
ncbi:hypothetical protein [Bacillus niameyensis]|nr:hypothetical protein [Bacillus niameyensis]